MHCRQIADVDVGGIAEVLGRGFPRLSREYWARAVDRLAKHPTPTGMPKFGYLLESAQRPVGVVLLISSLIKDNGTFTVRCNVSSWFVEQNFRIHAPLLISQAIRKKEITYFNISPAKHTQPIIEAQGFLRYSNGQFVVPALPSARRRGSVQVVGLDVQPNANFEPFERDLLLSHAEYGCISMWCTTNERAYPFVFLPRLVKQVIPCVQLAYCRHMEDFVRFARPIGSYLAVRGKPFVLIDSKGPIRGLVGKYFDGITPKYFKGPTPPRLGDLAYTEATMFGGWRERPMGLDTVGSKIAT